MSPRIKFCGFTREVDIDAALELRVDYLGLILVRESPRGLDWARARQLRQHIGQQARVVLLTRNASSCELLEWSDAIKPDLLQFHGDEDPALCAQIGLPWWKAVPMGALSDAQAVQGYLDRYHGAERWLFDSHGQQSQGGRGVAFDWSRLHGMAAPYVLAGGLKPETVAGAIQQLRPWAVDVASGIEQAPGIKDPVRMRAFVDAVRQT
ncbi:N-(5'-phosphoribosyl)anthranilate isomerase [Ahniella affigens]|uniref:N-(5'-phosphoribosyl)anthranilate isomerase n=1 Tax=Ahniella affigens TaxID=2021234 RepID=A0A2P1PU78_9GAMM|nr:phosphoribosylanthranilate isomerase [Ahniella affigens]AVP98399.1 N-(5'-phosphoribosyl)anthranilate isomerase [Ahniella affigens]